MANYALWKIGETEYRLKLSTGEIERLERTYGMGNLVNPIMSIGQGSDIRLPSLTYMIDIVHAGLQRYHHGLSRSAVAALYDDYVDAGGNQTELMTVVIEVFKASGFFPSEEAPTPPKLKLKA